MAVDVLKNLNREHVIGAMAELRSTGEGVSGDPMEHALVSDGRRYSPRKVLDLALLRTTGKKPALHELGSEAECLDVLRRLGFSIQPEVVRVGAGDDWSERECRALVDDYFAMLRSEIEGVSYNKAEHLRALAPALNDRSPRSIEFKHRNVSAVLDEVGFLYIQGYKPAKHYQALLSTIVLEKLSGARDVLSSAERISASLPPDDVDDQEMFERALEAAPPPEQVEPPAPRTQRKPKKYDFRLKDESNRALGKAGEEFVFGYERWRLRTAGRCDLADRVRWTANEVGDGAGYDIDSFEIDGRQILIEVKTTNWGKRFPFLISANEVLISAAHPESFRLYRVFRFSSAPRLYVVSGSIDAVFNLVPRIFEARHLRVIENPE